MALASALVVHRVGTHGAVPVDRPGGARPPTCPALGRDAVVARLAARVTPSPVPPMSWPVAASHEPQQRMTLQPEQFVATLRDVDVGVALADLRAARTSDSTKAANGAAYPLYRLVRDKLGTPPWPPTTDTPEAFAAYLRFSWAYKAPQAYWWAIVQHTRELGHFCAFEQGPTAWWQASSGTCPSMSRPRRSPCLSFAGLLARSPFRRSSFCCSPWSPRSSESRR